MRLGIRPNFNSILFSGHPVQDTRYLSVDRTRGTYQWTGHAVSISGQVTRYLSVDRTRTPMSGQDTRYLSVDRTRGTNQWTGHAVPISGQVTRPRLCHATSHRRDRREPFGRRSARRIATEHAASWLNHLSPLMVRPRIAWHGADSNYPDPFPGGVRLPKRRHHDERPSADVSRYAEARYRRITCFEPINSIVGQRCVLSKS